MIADAATAVRDALALLRFGRVDMAALVLATVPDLIAAENEAAFLDGRAAGEASGMALAGAIRRVCLGEGPAGDVRRAYLREGAKRPGGT